MNKRFSSIGLRLRMVVAPPCCQDASVVAAPGRIVALEENGGSKLNVPENVVI